MGKPMYERLHLDKDSYSKEKYDDVYEKLKELTMVDKKKYHYIYELVQELIIQEFERRGLKPLDLVEIRENGFEDIVDDVKIEDYFKGRLETTLDIDLEEAWEARLSDLKGELVNLFDHSLVEILLQANTIEAFIDLMLVKTDDYWRYKSNYTLYLLKESGFEFKKELENDRVWQPKS